jgi:threonine dehydratase
VAESLPDLAGHLTAQAIRDAAGLIAPHLHRTPLMRCATLDRMTGCEVHLKAECFQKTGCFKPRGALNRIARLSPAERERGVLAASAGNHAQGLAYAAAAGRIPVKVVMPEATPPAKIQATCSMGAEVILHGEIFDDALEEALRIAESTGMTFVHPATDPWVVAGAGTVGLEIIEDLPEFDALVCPVGGGGLLCGIGTAVRERLPGARLFGVNASGADAMSQSFRAGRVVRLERGRSIAEGIAGRAGIPGTLALMRGLVEDIVTVGEREILDAILLLLTRVKILAEGAGAAPLAALMAGKIPVAPGSRVVLVVSGGNLDIDMLSGWILEGLPEPA